MVSALLLHVERLDTEEYTYPFVDYNVPSQIDSPKQSQMRVYTLFHIFHSLSNLKTNPNRFNSAILF